MLRVSIYIYDMRKKQTESKQILITVPVEYLPDIYAAAAIKMVTINRYIVQVAVEQAKNETTNKIK